MNAKFLTAQFYIGRDFWSIDMTATKVIKEAENHSEKYITWYSDEVRKGIAAADAGQTCSHAEVGQMLRDAGVPLV